MPLERFERKVVIREASKNSQEIILAIVDEGIILSRVSKYSGLISSFSLDYKDTENLVKALNDELR